MLSTGDANTSFLAPLDPNDSLYTTDYYGAGDADIDTVPVGELTHVKLVIADVDDEVLDSAVFIQGHSIGAPGNMPNTGDSSLTLLLLVVTSIMLLVLGGFIIRSVYFSHVSNKHVY